MQKLPIKSGLVEMNHGAGGRSSHQLIESIFFKHFNNATLNQATDAASLSWSYPEVIMTTDSYVITPLFFPGGDIGSLAVYGTINDLAMAGSIPSHISASFILEEGFPLKDLNLIAQSMAMAAKECHVEIVTGDTKVVEKGAGDGVYINTTGIGHKLPKAHITHNLQIGDQLIISGPIGYHGVAVMSKRENLTFETDIHSDCQPLHELVKTIFDHTSSICLMRDLTRGGLGCILNEWAHQHQCGISISEPAVPLDEPIAAACELLGLDPMYLANEGLCLIACPADQSEYLLNQMRQHPLARHASIIGEIITKDEAFVEMKTLSGGFRAVDWLMGQQLPRIC